MEPKKYGQNGIFFSPNLESRSHTFALVPKILSRCHIKIFREMSSKSEDGGSEYPQFEGGDKVVYCGVSGYPLEMCEYHPLFEKCLVWWEENHPEMLDDYLEENGLESAEELTSKVSKRAIKASKKKANAASKVKRGVIIERSQRSKRKFNTIVRGLETFEIDLKKASKLFGKKFACGSAVSKTASGGKEIIIQGDVAYELIDFLEEEYEIDPSSVKTMDKKKGKKR